jgi:hypothetical protein
MKYQPGGPRLPLNAKALKDRQDFLHRSPELGPPVVVGIEASKLKRSKGRFLRLADVKVPVPHIEEGRLGVVDAAQPGQDVRPEPTATRLRWRLARKRLIESSVLGFGEAPQGVFRTPHVDQEPRNVMSGGQSEPRICRV